MTYRRMDEMTAEDMAANTLVTAPNPLDAMIAQLEALRDEDHGSAAVDRYTHSLQTASRAMHDGEDEETIVCALFHDVGDLIAPHNHAELAAAALRPFVTEQNYWVIRHHDLFQGYYYFKFLDKDPKLRDAYRGHPYYKACVRFCERWDQRAFDPAYPTEPLNRFLPMAREIFSRKPMDMLYIRTEP